MELETIKKSGTKAIDVQIGVRLREVRKNAGLSQKIVAERLGISFQQLQRYEQGENRVTAASLHHIAQLFGLPMEYFVRGEAAQRHEVVLVTDDEARLIARLRRVEASVFNQVRELVELKSL